MSGCVPAWTSECLTAWMPGLQAQNSGVSWRLFARISVEIRAYALSTSSKHTQNNSKEITCDHKTYGPHEILGCLDVWTSGCLMSGGLTV